MKLKKLSCSVPEGLWEALRQDAASRQQSLGQYVTELCMRSVHVKRAVKRLGGIDMPAKWPRRGRRWTSDEGKFQSTEPDLQER